MKYLSIVFALAACTNSTVAQIVRSPDGTVSAHFALTADGRPTYAVSYNNTDIIEQSVLGIELANRPSLVSGFRIARVDSSTFDETWEPVWGEERSIRNHYNELAVTLQQTDEATRTILIRFRLFDDGLGFRYEFPAQDNLKSFIVADELTEFNLTGDHKTFWIPGDYDSQEYFYSTTKLSDIDATRGEQATDIAVRTLIGPNAVQTPLMMKTADGLYFNIHEAALVNYPAMQLVLDKDSYTFSAHLVPDAPGNKAYLQTPAHTPWRTIVVADDAPSILQSRLILNLNDPSKIEDTSWIRPMKYIGIWWGMHIGKYTWNYSDTWNLKLNGTDWKALPPNGRHGATTENTKRYIDFAAEHGFHGVLVEGWNVGWEDWFGQWKEEVFDFVTPYPDFDVVALQQYAAAKGVDLIMHHETSSSVTNYERRLDDALDFMKQYGYKAVKTGYVGRIIPRGEHHDGQWMVNHYLRVADKMAARQIMLNAHEPVRPTGLHRTYPNWLANEAARGNEFNSGWSPTGNPPEHETILPFTRLMGGPMDYTPGIFQIRFADYAPDRLGETRTTVQTTLAKQLALYVTMYSPFQMAADLPEHYEKFLDALQFIEDVAVDWDQTRVLEAEPGDYLTIARNAKGTDDWFVGSITDENARTTEVALSFLKPDTRYLATLYLDAATADYIDNPMDYEIRRYQVTSKNVLKLRLARSGGAAISIKPGTPDTLRGVKAYENDR